MKKSEFIQIFNQEKALKLEIQRCRYCLGNVSLLKGKENNIRCTKKICRKSDILIKNEIFNNSPLLQEKIVEAVYMLLLGTKKTDITNLTDVSLKVIRKILIYLGKIAKENLNKKKIGGNKVIVEIDESKFGKRKYNRGHRVNGTWIIGGVERTTERKIFLAAIEKRNRKNINSIIEKNIIQGSIIYTDCWRGYSDLQKKFVHNTVNHSIGFKNHLTGVHTNTIEGTWFAIKSFIKKNNFSGRYLEYYLNLFVYFRNEGNNAYRALIKRLINYFFLFSFIFFCSISKGKKKII